MQRKKQIPGGNDRKERQEQLQGRSPAHGLHLVAAHLVVVEAFEPAAEVFGA